jgi:ribosomal-protein-alanine N-acetyltransferase
MQKYKLRDFRIEDIDQMLELDRLCFPPMQAFPEEVFYYYLYGLQSISLVIQRERGGLVAFIIFSNIKRKVWELVTIDVHPEVRRMGFGKTLITKGLESVEQRHPKLIELHVSINNNPAIALYEKYGFFIVKKLSNYYNDGNDAYLMHKEY